MILDKTELKNKAKDNILNVVFLKNDGSERNMRCTLKLEYLPEYAPSSNPKADNPDVLAVWDLDKQAWRSFRLDSVLSIGVE